MDSRSRSVCREKLYIGGQQVTRGYLGRPEGDGETIRFPDSFSRRPGARLYRTGDRAKRRADGTVEFLGRIDHQVKLRGFRIELGDIEAQLRREPGVADAVTVVRETGDGTQQLVTYLAGPSMLDVAGIRARLALRLPEYMVPQHFVSLDAFPLTANGKLDRAALPDPEQLSAAALTTYVAPRNRTEEILAAIWQTVLQVERVGVHDNFFRAEATRSARCRSLPEPAGKGVRADAQATLRTSNRGGRRGGGAR